MAPPCVNCAIDSGPAADRRVTIRKRVASPSAANTRAESWPVLAVRRARTAGAAAVCFTERPAARDISRSVALDVPSRRHWPQTRSEEHTSELQSLMRISYAVFCLKKKNLTELTTP